MVPDGIESFDEFWPYYLQEHSSRSNRMVHVAGTSAALLIAGAAIAKRKPKLLALAPVVGYGMAWIGHFVIEKNRPATFQHPLWSLLGDFKMAGMTVTGQMEDELARLNIISDEDIIDMV